MVCMPQLRPRKPEIHKSPQSFGPVSDKDTHLTMWGQNADPSPAKDGTLTIFTHRVAAVGCAIVKMTAEDVYTTAN